MQVTGNKSLISNSLSIRLGADGLSFYITDSADGRLLEQRHFSVTQGDTLLSLLGRVLGSPAFTRVEYARVSVLVDSPSTRVPLQEFRDDEVQAVYRLVFGDVNLQGEVVRHDVLSALEIVELYPVDLQAELVVKQYFPQSEWHSFYGQMLEHTGALYRRSQTTAQTMYVVTRASQMLVTVFSPSGLLFANTFRTPSNANRRYFILNVWKQLEMSQDDDICVLMDEEEELQQMLEQYVTVQRQEQ